MATVYSLVVWGGLTGNSVTANSTTDLLTLTNHGLRSGFGVFFSSGTLPTVSGAALALNTLYYTKPIASNTFELYYDSALTSQINFISNGASLILKSGYLLGLDLSRWGGTRVFGGVALANSVRSANGLPADDEVVEIADAFTETVAATANIGSGFASSYTFETRVNGVRSAAFHNGIPDSGYVWYSTAATTFYTSQINVTVDGLDFVRNSASGSATTSSCYVTYGGNVFRDNIVRNIGTGLCHGIYATGTLAEVYNNIVIGIHPGATTVAGIAVSSGARVYNNTVTKCGVGLIGYSGGGSYGHTYNNLVVGNDINYGLAPLYTATRADGNIGETKDLLTMTATAGSTTLVLSAEPPCAVNQQVFFETSGTLPAPLSPDRSYYIRSKTGANVTVGTSYNGSAITMTDAGTGTHKMSLVWATTNPPANYVDFTYPDDVFVDWANNDLRPAGYGTATPGSQAKMVDTALTIRGAVLGVDILSKERPQYRGGAVEYKDVGAFEMDFGYGPRPASYVVNVTGLPIGVEVRCYVGAKDGTATEVAGIESTTSGTFSFTHNLGGQTGFFRMIDEDYKIVAFDYTYQSGDAEIIIQPDTDPWFKNP